MAKKIVEFKIPQYVWANGMAGKRCEQYIREYEDAKKKFMAEVKQSEGLGLTMKQWYRSLVKLELRASLHTDILNGPILRVKTGMGREQALKEWDDLLSWLDGRVQSKARSFTQSTNPLSNLDDQIELAMMAEALQELRRDRIAVGEQKS